MKQSIIRGEDGKQAIELIAERMNTSYKNAQRLFRTESSHIQNEATFNAYKESGVVEKYEYLATLDSRTSKTCEGMDSHVFKLSEKEVGVNFPPLHPNCRSTTVPYFDDEIDPGERIARDENGKSYYVSGDTSYKKWYNEYVKGNILELRDASRYSIKYLKKMNDTFDYFKENGFTFKEHAINRVLGPKKGKGKRDYKKEDILDVLRTGKKYLQKEGDKTAYFKNGLAVLQANDTGEITSVIDRGNPRADWSEFDG